MRRQNEVESAQRENSPGGFLGELAFDVIGDLLPDSLIGYIILILAVVFVLVIRSAMNE